MSVRHSFSAKYAGLCLIAMGAFSAGPIIVCWYVMNLHGHAERSIGTAWMIGFGNSRGAWWRRFRSWRPTRRAIGRAIRSVWGATCVGVLALVGYAGLVVRENRKLRAAGGGEKGLRRFAL